MLMSCVFLGGHRPTSRNDFFRACNVFTCFRVYVFKNFGMVRMVKIKTHIELAYKQKFV